MSAVSVPVALAGATANDDEPTVWNEVATDITDTSAVLRARIDPEDDDGAEYLFQYGPGNYGTSTAWNQLSGQSTKDVAVPIAGLTAGAAYQFRALVRNDDGLTVGAKKTFVAKAAPDSAGPAVAPDPALGKTVVAEVAAGEVFYRERGSFEFLPLDRAAELPVDSVLDTTQGTVVLETALPGGKTQEGTFRGGQFQVRQSRRGRGMTQIALRGGDFSACEAGSATRAIYRKRGEGAVRKLWAKDKGGRFKTSGKGSVATVRGTRWFTADRCDGTLTRVSRGAVLVRERGTGQRKLLERGQSFLAQPSGRKG